MEGRRVERALRSYLDNRAGLSFNLDTKSDRGELQFKLSTTQLDVLSCSTGSAARIRHWKPERRRGSAARTRRLGGCFAGGTCEGRAAAGEDGEALRGIQTIQGGWSPQSSQGGVDERVEQTPIGERTGRRGLIT